MLKAAARQHLVVTGEPSPVPLIAPAAVAPAFGEPRELMPSMSWDQLETVMIDMTTGPDQQVMVRHLLQGVRGSAGQLPAETVLREILIIAAAVGAGARTRETDPC